MRLGRVARPPRLVMMLMVTPLAGLAVGCARPDVPVDDAGVAVPVAAAEQVPRAVVDAVDLTRLRTGPAHPELGVPYPYDLLTHCGIEMATFAGRRWRADGPVAEPSPRADAEGNFVYTGYTAGAMTLIAANRARFVIDERRYLVSGDAAVRYFRPAGKGQRTICK